MWYYIYIYIYVILHDSSITCNIISCYIVLHSTILYHIARLASERGRFKLSQREPTPNSDHNLAQDKGGPSKGLFLNNRLFSYTDLYLCNEINGMCAYIICDSGK